MIIELIYNMKLLMPTVGARIHKNTPKSFLELLGKVLRHGQGEPIIYNDDTIIPEYERLGILSNEAIDYSSDGCWETVIPGLTNFRYLKVMVLQCLEFTMNRGVEVKTGQKISIDTGALEDFKTFEDFYSAFLKQVYFQMEGLLDQFLYSLGLTAFVAPDPLFSSLSENCRKTGLDYYGLGAKYQLRMLLVTGLADTIDSLLSIKKIVFEEKRLTLPEFNEVLLNNWQGHERLRMYIMNKVPKYGNDDSEADSLVVRFLEDYATKVRELRKLSKKIVLNAGIGTFHMYAKWGNGTAASANGRYAYDAIAPNYSPVPGCDKNGPLSVINSALKADLSEFMAGTPVDISINYNEFTGEQGIKRLEDMILEFCNSGGQILTITSTSVDELISAKKQPERYKHLRVRMGGLSAYFVQLAPIAQDKIIERFRHS